MTFNVVVVADRDLCRGPVAAAVLREQLVLGPLRGELLVTSRGVRQSRSPVCAAAAESGVTLVDHVPTVLSEADRATADLILAIDPEQRSAVVALDRSVRGRCFTITEAHVIAVWLNRGAPLPDGVEVIGASARPDSRPERLRWWVAEMDRSRGLPNLMEPPTLRSAHVGAAVSHAEAMATVIDVCTALGGALRQLLR